MKRSELVRIAEVRALARSGEARRLRRRAGISVPELAESLGVSAASVSRWERGESAPRPADALAYGRVLAALAVRDAVVTGAGAEPA